MIGYKITCKLIRQGLSKLVNKYGAITNKSETKYLVTKDSEKYITIKTA